MHFVTAIKEISVEELARLSRDNVWKLYRLLESVISDKNLQFVTNLIRELNKMLDIQIKLSTVFHLQINGQTEHMNQKLKQYLQFFVDHRQMNWPE